MSTTPAEVVEALEQSAARFETPCGDGHMVWRRWGSGPPLVLLHGGFGSWTHWVRNIDTLARHRTLWVADMPGYGDSDLPHEPFNFEAMAGPIAAGIRTLVPDDAQFDIGGFSLGSYVSLYVARDLESRVRRHVMVTGQILGPFAAMPNQMLERWREVADPRERTAILKRNLRVLMLSRDEAIDDLAAHVYALDLPRARIRPQHFVNTRDDGLIARLRVPVSAIAGEFDPIANPNTREQGEKLIEFRRDSVFHVIPSVGHWVQYEAPDVFNSAFLAALA